METDFGSSALIKKKKSCKVDLCFLLLANVMIESSSYFEVLFLFLISKKFY